MGGRLASCTGRQGWLRAPDAGLRGLLRGPWVAATAPGPAWAGGAVFGSRSQNVEFCFSWMLLGRPTPFCPRYK